MLRRVLAYPAMTLALAACVTINIYFPAAAAEEAARTIVRDVLGADQGAPEKGQQAPGGQPQSALPRDQALWLVWAGRTLEWLIPPAQAAQADIDIDTPVVRALRDSMRARQARLGPFYRSGAIGLDRNALVTIRDPATVGLRDRNRLRKLVADENRDRNALYREIARANGHPEWEEEIRRTFAKVWAEEAPAGYWYQDAGGGWHRK